MTDLEAFRGIVERAVLRYPRRDRDDLRQEAYLALWPMLQKTALRGQDLLAFASTFTQRRLVDWYRMQSDMIGRRPRSAKATYGTGRQSVESAQPVARDPFHEVEVADEIAFLRRRIDDRLWAMLQPFFRGAPLTVASRLAGLHEDYLSVRLHQLATGYAKRRCG